MTGEDFISVATQLLASKSEAHFRTAVGRAYYAAFHLARDFVRACGVLVPAGPEAHKSVRWCLANVDDAELGEAASQLESLRTARNKADYDLSFGGFVQSANARVHVQRSVEVATIVKRARLEDVSSKMRAYATSINLPVKG